MIDNTVFEEKMREGMKKEGDPIIVLQEAMNEATLAYVKTFPVWMRCNFLLNKISQIPEENIKDINWDIINEILSAKSDEIDFNCFDSVNSIEDLLEIKVNSEAAEIPEFNSSFHKKKCKCCGDEFTLTKGEINYFFKNSLKVPGKCYYCRKKIEKPKPISVKKAEIIPEKTAMQLAMEKAGISK